MMLGDVARGVLQGAPCPAAVAPKGYRGDGPRTIAVGFDGTNESRVALDVAQRLAADRRAALSVFVVWEDPPTPIAEVAWIESSELREETHTQPTGCSRMRSRSCRRRRLEAFSGDVRTSRWQTLPPPAISWSSGHVAGERSTGSFSAARPTGWSTRRRRRSSSSREQARDERAWSADSRWDRRHPEHSTGAGCAGARLRGSRPGRLVSPAFPVPGSASWPAIAVNGSGQVALAWAGDEAPGARRSFVLRAAMAARPPAGSSNVHARPRTDRRVAHVSATVDRFGEVSVAWVEQRFAGGRPTGSSSVRAAFRTRAGRWSRVQVVGRSSAFANVVPRVASAPDGTVALSWTQAAHGRTRWPWRGASPGISSRRRGLWEAATSPIRRCSSTPGRCTSPEPSAAASRCSTARSPSGAGTPLCFSLASRRRGLCVWVGG